MRPTMVHLLPRTVLDSGLDHCRCDLRGVPCGHISIYPWLERDVLYALHHRERPTSHCSWYAYRRLRLGGRPDPGSICTQDGVVQHELFGWSNVPTRTWQLHRWSHLFYRRGCIGVSDGRSATKRDALFESKIRCAQHIAEILPIVMKKNFDLFASPGQKNTTNIFQEMKYFYLFEPQS